MAFHSIADFVVYRVILTLCITTSVAFYRPQERCLTGYMTDVQSWVNDVGGLTSVVPKMNAIDLSSNGSAVQTLMQRVPSRVARVSYLSMAKCGLKRVPNVFMINNTNGVILSETVEYMTFFGNEFGDVSSTGERYDTELNATKAQEITVSYNRLVSSNWYAGFQGVKFQRLRELDLRGCGIKTLESYVFEGMPHLESLYLGENSIAHIHANAFVGLTNLIHLDLSRNIAIDNHGNHRIMTTDSMEIFANLNNLMSLDMSFTRIHQTHIAIFRRLGQRFERLSLCDTGVVHLDNNFFNGTSIRYLDLSGNIDIFMNHNNILGGLEETLQVLYVERAGVNTFEIFENFKRLEILKLSNNEISVVPSTVASSLKNLQVLDLHKNRVSAWFNPTYSLMPQLKFLTLSENNINVISEEMIDDFKNILYLSLGGNFVICNCFVIDLYDMALTHEQNHNNSLLGDNNSRQCNGICYHNGYEYYNKLIISRFSMEQKSKGKSYSNQKSTDSKQAFENVVNDNDDDYYNKLMPLSHNARQKSKPKSDSNKNNTAFREVLYNVENDKEYYNKLMLSTFNMRQKSRARGDLDQNSTDYSQTIDDNGVNDTNSENSFVLVDYSPELYHCLLVDEGRTVQLSEYRTCIPGKRDHLDNEIRRGVSNLIALIVISCICFPVLVIIYVFRRNLKYFYITLRNSATLSVINKNEASDADIIYDYDVFVSYCHEDRDWVLDHLIPSVEKNCNISVCLHERDFQVGLSILENIVSCMDRSRSIMLILSKKFLSSQWCKFEMHLAQHRLLETRREDLILVLLEDIPRRIRPTTLHYLMLTKTYIIWPKQDSEQKLFWRRLLKSIVTQRLKTDKMIENASLA